VLRVAIPFYPPPTAHQGEHTQDLGRLGQGVLWRYFNSYPFVKSSKGEEQAAGCRDYFRVPANRELLRSGPD